MEGLKEFIEKDKNSGRIPKVHENKASTTGEIQEKQLLRQEGFILHSRN